MNRGNWACRVIPFLGILKFKYICSEGSIRSRPRPLQCCGSASGCAFRARIVNLLRCLGIDSLAGGPARQSYLTYRPARLHRQEESIPGLFKGTQEWEFFWLRFLILYYFIVSYVKILRFCKKNFLIGPVLEQVRFFRVVLRLRGMEKNFELGKKNIFFIFLFMNPLYELILVFPKFDPLTAPEMALCVNLGPKCQNLSSLAKSETKRNWV